MRRLTILIVTLLVLLSFGSTLLAQQIHVVQRGETLSAIAASYGKTFAEVALANGLAEPYVIHAGNQLVIPGTAPAAPAQSPAPAAAAPQPSGVVGYTVQSGDLLATIAARFNTTYLVLAEMNGIADPNILFVGQVLAVPAVAAAPAPSAPAAPAAEPTIGSYTVQPGDFLSTIAARFGINYFDLAAMNDITDLDSLRVGQVLKVPGAPPPPAPAPAAPGAPPAAAPPPSTVNTGGFELGGQALTFAHPGAMHSARMTWVKRQVVWRGEPASNFQNQIDAAHGNGFKVLLSVIGDKNQIASNPGAYYQNFANFLAGLARGGADAIEVWNEMNIDHEWPPGHINGANYVQMLSAAYNAIKSANPGTMVISGAPAPTGGLGCTPSGSNDDCYMRDMAAAGAANYMDCVGVHYNAGIVPPDARSGAPVGSSGHYSWYLPRMMELYRGLFPTKPLCFTELGYLTGDGFGGLPAHFSWASGNTLAEQAAWLGGSVHVTRNSGYVRLLIIWNVDSNQYGADPQAGYAIVRPGGGCPACDTLRAAMGG